MRALPSPGPGGVNSRGHPTLLAPWVLVLAFALPLLGLAAPAAAVGPWYVTGRAHGELHWQVLETEHFRVVYHQGLEETARRAAGIAEEVYDPITRQLDTRPRRKTSLVLTDSDEIVNGYALHTGQIFIWVHLNDYLGRFSGTEKWLRKVIAHEFEHVVAIEALRTWAGPWNLMFVPAWFLEGLAEYFTESWGIDRSDADVRAHALRNRLGDLDPHDSGFARVLYLAERHGDSTLVKIVKHREPVTGLYSFEKAFKAATGTSVADFLEEWRRAMNATYYGYLGQKEEVTDTGEALPLPISRVRGLAWAPDSSRIAVLGARGGMRDLGLYLVSADSLRRVREVDHGVIDPHLSWAPDAGALVYARYHRGAHGSLTWDLYRLDLGEESGARGRRAQASSGGEARGGAQGKPRGRWLTWNARANDPSWSPDGREIVYLAHPGETTNLYLMDAEGGGERGGGGRPLTAFTGDVQVLSPRWSPDGQWIAFTYFGEEGGPDIAVVRRDGSGFRTVTADTAYDLLPQWSPDGRRIHFTSYRDGTANLFSVPFGEAAGGPLPAPERLTDVGEGMWGAGMAPHTDRITALTLPTVDSARVVQVSGERRVEATPLALRPPYLGWQTHAPEIALGRGAEAAGGASAGSVILKGPYRYRAWQDVRLVGWAAFPSDQGLGGLVVAEDGLGRHVVAVGGTLLWNGEAPSGYVSYLHAGRVPLLQLSAYRGTRAGFRMYERKLLTEQLDGVSLAATFPYNRGRDLASNFSLTVYADLADRKPVDAGRFGGRLPIPESGREGVVGVGAQWVRRRPHRVNGILPVQGAGAALRWEHASAEIFGDFSYDRYVAESFANRRLPLPGWALYGRLKFEAVNGRPPRQLFVGVTPDEALYLPPEELGSLIVGEFVRRRETVRLRGWPEVWLGDRALWTTVEVRLPLAPALPVDVLGLRMGRLTGALFTDAASVWNEGEAAARDWRSTVGAELRHEVRFADMTLFVGSWGVGERWNELRHGRTVHVERYFRLALVNPF